MREPTIADGPYKPLIERFVAWRAGKGLRPSSDFASSCGAISRALAGQPDASGLDEAAVRAILAPVGDEGQYARARRVTTMRQLCAFLDAVGVPCWQVPARFFTPAPSDFRPYVLSDADIDALLVAADSLPPRTSCPGYELAYPEIARLLLACGLRVSELLALTLADVSREDGALHVTNSKNGVSRLVPLAPANARRVIAYADSTGRSEGPLFMSPRTRGPYSYYAMRYMFRRLYTDSGVRTEDGELPRIHDLRHTFCTRSLDRMLASGVPEFDAIPLLAAYVGHVNYADTERYLHLTSAGRERLLEQEAGLGALIPKAVV